MQAVPTETVATGVSKHGLFIPVIDFGTFLHGSDGERSDAVIGLMSGFKNAGFVYIKNHGILQSTIDEIFVASASFFALPQAEKDALNWVHPSSNRGYVTLGREKVTRSSDATEIAALRASAPDLKESFEIGRDNHQILHNNWPTHLPSFRVIMNSFYNTCQSLHVQVMRALALGLSLPEMYFDTLISEADNNLRLLHYPPTPATAFKNGQVRAGSHTDYGTVTLLFQDVQGGLQVRSPQRSWVDVTPIAGTIVVNAGDLLARWTNGIITSTEHRVVEPPSVPVLEEHPARYSCVYFCNPNAEVLIEALPGTYDKDGKKEPPVRADEYLLNRLAKTYQY